MRKHGYRHKNQFSRSISLDDMVVSRCPFKNWRPSWILAKNGKTRSVIFWDFYMGHYKTLTDHCAKFGLCPPNFNPLSTFMTKISRLLPSSISRLSFSFLVPRRLYIIHFFPSLPCSSSNSHGTILFCF